MTLLSDDALFHLLTFDKQEEIVDGVKTAEENLLEENENRKWKREILEFDLMKSGDFICSLDSLI